MILSYLDLEPFFHGNLGSEKQVLKRWEVKDIKWKCWYNLDFLGFDY